MGLRYDKSLYYAAVAPSCAYSQRQLRAIIIRFKIMRDAANAATPPALLLTSFKSNFIREARAYPDTLTYCPFSSSKECYRLLFTAAHFPFHCFFPDFEGSFSMRWR